MKEEKKAVVGNELETKPLLINAATLKGMTIAERVLYLTANGINTREPDGGLIESHMPDVGEIIDIVSHDYVINKTTRKGLRLVVKDINGAMFTCSKSKVTGLQLQQDTPEQFISLGQIGADSNGNVTLYGRKKLSNIPQNNAELFDLVGKKFKATKINVFSVPFQQKFTSKSQASDSVRIADFYKVDIE